LHGWLNGEDEENDEGGDCRCVQDDVKRVDADAVACGQESVSGSEHALIAGETFWFGGAAKPGRPPGFEFAYKEEEIGDPKEDKKPVRPSTVQEVETAGECNEEGKCADQGAQQDLSG